MSLNPNKKKKKKNAYKIYEQDNYKCKLKIVIAHLAFFEEYDLKSKLN